MTNGPFELFYKIWQRKSVFNKKKKSTYNRTRSEVVCTHRSTGIMVRVVYNLSWQIMLFEVIISPEWVEDNDLLYHSEHLHCLKEMEHNKILEQLEISNFNFQNHTLR